METIKDINLVELSKYISAFRGFFAGQGYFEQALYSTVPYAVTNTDTFKVKEGLFLRHYPEPEIWAAAKEADKFFWIDSLYRNENAIDKIHNYEFKVVDFYIKNATPQEIIGVFLEALNQLEQKMSLPSLSKKGVKYITYDNFEKGLYDRTGTYWLAITDYPKNESFYDAPLGGRQVTSKFELMFAAPGEITEIAAAGIIGENMNSVRRIENSPDLKFSEEVYAENFMGLGFGVERLIYLYK